MAIFNSLGSNYSKSFVWQSLRVLPSRAAVKAAERQLSQMFGGQTTLTYKGRDALQLALERSGLAKGSAVAINGFTCYVVYQAVTQAGYRPVFVDISPGQINYGLSELKAIHVSNPGLKAVIVQNSLGYPADMVKIMAYCRDQNFMVIEDLAHSMGAIYADGKLAGTVGDNTMLSFSQDKPLDIVAGGALIDRKKGAEEVAFNGSLVSLWQRLRNRYYPFWTSLIRGLYISGLGRLLHAVLRKLKLLAGPMQENRGGLHAMSPSAGTLLSKRLSQLDAEVNHRRTIAAIYNKELPAELIAVKQITGQASFLRFPIITSQPKDLTALLREQHVYVADTWYDAPIGPQRYLDQTSYVSGQCPNAEALCQQLINLPTHRYVTPEIALDICAKIKQWHA